jgi:hypothetical protein
MIANHIHDALAQVRRVQQVILERRAFRGYSGAARAAGGLVALAGAAVLSSACLPQTEWAHLAGWGVILAVALGINYGALGYWFLFDSETRRDFLRLMPAVDAIPPLAVAGILSLTLVVKGQFDLLFGTWMCLYGLVHVPYRLSLPRANYGIGLYYILCGTVCLFTPLGQFLHPWSMGLVFFVGEVSGGLLLHQHRLVQEEKP